MTRLKIKRSGSFVNLDAIGSVPLTHGRYKGAHNTGIPSGTTLGTPELPIFPAAGEIVTDRIFVGSTRPTNNNIVYRRCVFRAGGDATAFDGSASSGVLLEDCLIDGGSDETTSMTMSPGINYTMRRCEIRGGVDVARLGPNSSTQGATWEDCWIHTPILTPGSHSDGTQIISGTGVQLLRCRIELVGYKTIGGAFSTIRPNATIQLGSFPTYQANNLLVEDCYLDGSDTYIINHNPAGQSHTGHVWRRNRFGPHYQYGYINPTYVAVADIDSTNVVDSTGVSVV